MSDEIPRRARRDLWIPAERAINDALQAVEALGAHPDLTAVVNKLSDAQRDIADWYDGGAPGSCTAVGKPAESGKLPKNFGKTDEEWRRWLLKYGDDPEGCPACGAMAGACTQYPNCPGNPEWRPETQPDDGK